MECIEDSAETVLWRLGLKSSKIISWSSCFEAVLDRVWKSDFCIERRQAHGSVKSDNYEIFAVQPPSSVREDFSHCNL